MTRGRVKDAALREETAAYRTLGGDRAPVRPLTCLDLCCGCRGFSLGMQRAEFTVLAAIDASPIATDVFHRNFSSVPLLLCNGLTTFPPERLDGCCCSLGAPRIAVLRATLLRDLSLGHPRGSPW